MTARVACQARQPAATARPSARLAAARRQVDRRPQTGEAPKARHCGSGADVELCSPYYVSLDCPEQARVLVHELAHHVPDLCSDHAYVGSPEYMALPPEQARTNPDTYAQFAKTVFRGAPSCVDCGFEVQRPGGRRY